MSGPNISIPGVAERHARNLEELGWARDFFAEAPSLPEPVALAGEIIDAWLPVDDLIERVEECTRLVDLADLPSYDVTFDEVQRARDLVAYLHRLNDLVATGLSGFRRHPERLGLHRDLRAALNSLTGLESLVMALASHDLGPGRSEA